MSKVPVRCRKKTIEFCQHFIVDVTMCLTELQDCNCVPALFVELETAGGEGVAAERLTPDLELRSVYRDFLRSLSFPTKTLLHYLSSPRCINRRRRYTRLEATLQ